MKRKSSMTLSIKETINTVIISIRGEEGDMTGGYIMKEFVKVR